MIDALLDLQLTVPGMCSLMYLANITIILWIHNISLNGNNNHLCQLSDEIIKDNEISYC